MIVRHHIKELICFDEGVIQPGSLVCCLDSMITTSELDRRFELGIVIGIIADDVIVLWSESPKDSGLKLPKINLPTLPGFTLPRIQF